MEVPNLFIPGAARCGTTSLHAILGQHPEVHAHFYKEPTFFNFPFRFVSNPFEYFDLFDSPKRYRLDASANYLANPRTPILLRKLFPEARFIITLRHPKEHAYSLFRLMRHLQAETISDFTSALKAEAQRSQSSDFATNCAYDFRNFLYVGSTLYDEQLRRYFSQFDRKQLHILTLAELAKDPRATTERMLQFLELDTAPARNFSYEPQGIIDSKKPRYDSESDRIMGDAFEGLTQRTDEVVGRALDWSL